MRFQTKTQTGLAVARGQATTAPTPDPTLSPAFLGELFGVAVLLCMFFAAAILIV